MGFVSQTLRDSAKGQDCTLQLPGVCNHDPATTVLAHLPSPVKGMGTKSDDFHAVFACSNCHTHMDMQRQHPTLPSYQLSALQRTQKFWFDNGLLTIAADKGMKIKRAPSTSKTLPPRKLFE
jgi:Protein of unknown function (DUF1364)